VPHKSENAADYNHEMLSFIDAGNAAVIGAKLK
jgi:hypothetical protein